VLTCLYCFWKFVIIINEFCILLLLCVFSSYTLEPFTQNHLTVNCNCSFTKHLYIITHELDNIHVVLYLHYVFKYAFILYLYGFIGYTWCRREKGRNDFLVRMSYFEYKRIKRLNVKIYLSKIRISVVYPINEHGCGQLQFMKTGTLHLGNPGSSGASTLCWSTTKRQTVTQ